MMRKIPIENVLRVLAINSMVILLLHNLPAFASNRDERAINNPVTKQSQQPNPFLTKLPANFGEPCMETTPVIYKGQPLLISNFRGPKSTRDEMYLIILDLLTGKQLSHFGEGHSFVSGFVNGSEMNVFAVEYGKNETEWTRDIYRFSSTDLKTWKRDLVMTREADEHFFNTSVCKDDHGFVLAYESNKPVQWSFRFARSNDLVHWEKQPGAGFADLEGRTACGNPTIRYIAPYYYMIYGAWRWAGPGVFYEYTLPETKYVTLIARSKDLKYWELSPTRNPMLEPSAGEGINNTDADLFEYEGQTYIYYATGDQATWGTVRIAMYPGKMKELLERYFPESVPMITFDAVKGRYTYPAK
jgi:hypothetical protein